MAYTDKADFSEAPIPGSGQGGEAAEEAAQVQALDALIEGLVRAVCDATLCGIISGWEGSPGTGLSLDVSAGSGFLRGAYCVSDETETVDSLPDDTATLYIYAHRGALPNGAKTVTFTASTSGSVPADGALLATCTTASGAVTDVDNSPAGRPADI